MDDSISKRIARKLRQARKSTRYTQEEIADRLGIARSAYGHIESGRNLISIEHLLKLPSILECRLTDLLPDSVLTDHDRQRSADPQLEQIIRAWPRLRKVERQAILVALQAFVSGAEEPP